MEREFSKVAKRTGFGRNEHQQRQYSDKLKTSHGDKFVTKTRDQPKPGSFFPRSLWGGEMKDPEVEQKAQYFSGRPCSFPETILD